MTATGSRRAVLSNFLGPHTKALLWPLSRFAQAMSVGAALASRRHPTTLKIEKSARQRFTVLTLSGRMEAKQVVVVKELFDRDYRNIILMTPGAYQIALSFPILQKTLRNFTGRMAI
jgi:hypothetical protein